MIRINLLSSLRAGRSEPGLIGAGQRVSVACSVILIVTVLIMGWRFWSIRQQTAQLEMELVGVDQELLRLGQILDEVYALDVERDQLAQRVDVIEILRQEQGSPVRMLDALSGALPEGLWLSALKQRGRVIVVRGQALGLESLSDFVANLEASEYFRAPVEIVGSQIEETDEGDLVKFEVKAVFDSLGS